MRWKSSTWVSVGHVFCARLMESARVSPPKETQGWLWICPGARVAVDAEAGATSSVRLRRVLKLDVDAAGILLVEWL